MMSLWFDVVAMLKALWRFLGTPIGVWAMRIAICVALLACGELHGFSRGVQHEKDAQAKRAEQDRKAVKALTEASAKITAKAQVDLEAANQKNADLALELQKKAKTYVTPKDDSACRIPVGYVLMRDAAGSGDAPVSPASGQSLGTDSGVVLSEVLENDILNATAFRAATNEIKAWRGWYASQAASWNAKTTSVDTARP